jgi:hypothetical protein
LNALATANMLQLLNGCVSAKHEDGNYEIAQVR